MEISDAAYAAGLFDGEGSVYYKKMKQQKHKRPGKPIHNLHPSPDRKSTPIVLK